LEGNNTTFRLIHKQSKNSTNPKNDKMFEERTEIKNNFFLEDYSTKKNTENSLLCKKSIA
jgi:hypothetical protein